MISPALSALSRLSANNVNNSARMFLRISAACSYYRIVRWINVIPGDRRSRRFHRFAITMIVARRFSIDRWCFGLLNRESLGFYEEGSLIFKTTLPSSSSLSPTWSGAVVYLRPRVVKYKRLYLPRQKRNREWTKERSAALNPARLQLEKVIKVKSRPGERERSRSISG